MSCVNLTFTRLPTSSAMPSATISCRSLSPKSFCSIQLFPKDASGQCYGVDRMCFSHQPLYRLIKRFCVEPTGNRCGQRRDQVLRVHDLVNRFGYTAGGGLSQCLHPEFW